MLTPRGFWLIVAGLFLAAAGAFARQPDVLVLAFALLIVVGIEAARFALWVRGFRRTAELQRHFRGGSRTVAARPQQFVWSDQPITVGLTIGFKSTSRSPWIQLRDLSPRSGLISGAVEWSGIPSQPMLKLEYRYRPPGPGVLRFDGARLRASDRFGFFETIVVLRQPIDVVALPPILPAAVTAGARKPRNILLAAGIHRHPRPGIGSELLDLRDYIPGDPPKAIAWKVSARRDRLVTKQFESQVPIRCTFFLDVGESTRRGRTGQTPMARAVHVTTDLASHLLAGRDPVGMCLIDSHQTRWLRPATGSRQSTRIHHLLIGAFLEDTPPAPAPLAPLLDTAWDFCQEVFPEEMAEPNNAKLAWYAQRPLLPIPLPILGTCAAVLLASLLLSVGLRSMVERAPMMWVTTQIALLLALWLWARRYRVRRDDAEPTPATKRKKLAALLAASDSRSADAIAQALVDDDHFSCQLQRFLSEHRIPFRRSIFHSDGKRRDALDGALIADRLRRALLRAVKDGRDNELFLLVVEPVFETSIWDPLYAAIAVAVGRHHQVVVLVHWPSGWPTPTAEESPPEVDANADLGQIVAQIEGERRHQGYHRMARSLSKLNVPLLCATDQQAASAIRERIERLRAARTTPFPVGPRH